MTSSRWLVGFQVALWCFEVSSSYDDYDYDDAVVDGGGGGGDATNVSKVMETSLVCSSFAFAVSRLIQEIQQKPKQLVT